MGVQAICLQVIGIQVMGVQAMRIIIVMIITIIIIINLYRTLIDKLFRKQTLVHTNKQSLQSHVFWQLIQMRGVMSEAASFKAAPL